MADQYDRDSFPKPQDDFGTENPFVSPVAAAERGYGQDYLTHSEGHLNPWISMWMKPRATVRQQLETNPTQYVLLLAALGGIGSNLDQTFDLADKLGSMLAAFVVAVIAGAIGGLIWLYLGGWLTGAVGRSLGGVAKAAEMRTALAWSNIPSIWLLPIGLLFTLYMAIGGAEAMADAIVVEGGEGLRAVSPFAWLLAFAGIVIGIWQLVITSQATGEAHQFSSLRGFGTLLLSGLVLLGIGFVIAFVFLGLFSL